MDSQVENAVELAFNPTTQQPLKAQAYDFLNQLRDDPNAWSICLALFVRDPSPSEVVRVVCLEIVNNAVQTQRLDQAGLNDVRLRLMDYIRRHYATEAAVPDSHGIQNKITQTITYLFGFLYPSDWVNFFEEFLSLATFGNSPIGSHAPITIMYLRILSSIHDEIADVMISKSQIEQKRSTDLKDMIRARDMGRIASTWQEILSRWRQLDLSMIELCLRTVAKWVSWVDITLVLNERIQSALLEIAGQTGDLHTYSKEANARDAAIDTFTETVGKKMPPSDKIELIGYLNLGIIVGQLIASRALSELRATSDYDTDLSEAVAKLVNNVVFDVVKVIDTPAIADGTRNSADQLLQTFVPYLLRFFADDYDEICSAVIPSLTDLLTMFRKLVKSKGSLPPQYSAMLQPILDAIVVKLRYDDTADWGEEADRTDEAEFQELRKRLHILQQTVATVDETMYMDTLSRVVANTFASYSAAGDKINWRDLDLALLEMHYFGELAIKNNGLYTKSNPTSEASSRLVIMMSTMVASNLANFPHPAVQLQYMENCVRYNQYFEHHPADIAKALESFVNFMHCDHVKIRLRSWYLFQRFAKYLRAQLSEYAQTVVQAVSDLLTIRAELPPENDNDSGSSEDNASSPDSLFQNQLYLFEAVGLVGSTHHVPLATRVAIMKSVIDPLSADISSQIASARNGDDRAVLQIHHIIMALGNLASGTTDWANGVSTSGPPPTEVSQEFINASETVLVCLENLKHHSDVRAAARHAFSRFLGVLGPNVLPQLPRWIAGLLSSDSSNDEMAMFLRTLGQVIHGFKSETFSILDELLSPLLQQVFFGLSQNPTGTDDEVQLKELKQQYLNLILVILNNDLGAVLVTPTNQASFDPFITSITRFACDPSDPLSARYAFSALAKMTAMWGGPDVAGAADSSSTSEAGDNVPTVDAPQPSLPGFDGFLRSTFAPLPWTFVSHSRFNSLDAQIRSVLQEAAALQWTILRKTGPVYRAQLERELRELGAGDDAIRSFLAAIGGDLPGFKKSFAAFIQQAKQ